jgi:hypothetical protein
MKNARYATASVSVLAAVLLWAIATWFEDDTRWLALGVGKSPDIAMVRTRPDTPVRAYTGTASCEQAEDVMRQKVADAQYCRTDDDCTLFDYGYPIECLTSVTKAEITMLRREYLNYEQSCAYRVYYDCPAGAAEREAVCRNTRCTVALKTVEQLQDETLEYLGIE